MINLTYEIYNNILYILIITIGISIVTISFLILFTSSSIHVILFLMFLFLYLTELTLILQMEFLGLIFIIIYIGAVCVLMLFHIKLIKTFLLKTINIYNEHIFSSFFFIFILLPILQLKTFNNVFFNTFDLNEEFSLNLILDNNLLVLNLDYIFWLDLIDYMTQLKLFGIFLYNLQILNLLFAAIILFIAMIGTIILSLNHKKY